MARHLIDPKSHRPVSLERWIYARELSRLLLELGFAPVWWQFGSGWRAEVADGVPVFGSLQDDGQILTWPTASATFLEQAGWIAGAIYFDVEMAYPEAFQPSVAVAHSVQWDDPLFESRFASAVEREEWKRRMWLAMTGPRSVVASDTGFIQWAMATWPGLYYKMLYIPNFVPSTGPLGPAAIDSPLQASLSDPARRRREDPVHILFPGSLVPQQGAGEALRACRRLARAFPTAQFLFAGSAPEGIAEAMREACGDVPNVRVEPDRLDDSKLAWADVVVYPAKFNQATSMSCLQAMAAGACVVVGQTGGLTDLVLHDHNGVICGPTSDQLAQVLEELIIDRDRRARLGARARLSATAFSLDRWRGRWTAVLHDVFGSEMPS